MTLILPFHYSLNHCAQTNYSEAHVQEKIETYLHEAEVISLLHPQGKPCTGPETG